MALSQFRRACWLASFLLKTRQWELLSKENTQTHACVFEGAHGTTKDFEMVVENKNKKSL